MWSFKDILLLAISSVWEEDSKVGKKSYYVFSEKEKREIIKKLMKQISRGRFRKKPVKLLFSNHLENNKLIKISQCEIVNKTPYETN